MRRLVLFIALATPVLYSQEETPDHRLRTSTAVLHEIMSAPDKGIPNDLLSKAQCVVIVPELKKAAFIVGGEYGRGFAVCRNHGTWGAPAAVRFSGGSFGAQIGGESTDIVMLVMSRRGMEKLATDKLKIGADASAAAGPVGRTATAATDSRVHDRHPLGLVEQVRIEKIVRERALGLPRLLGSEMTAPPSTDTVQRLFCQDSTIDKRIQI
jgi:SH3 domain-containing YSC84-like protein 1